MYEERKDDEYHPHVVEKNEEGSHEPGEVRKNEIVYDFPHLIHYLTYTIFVIVEGLLLMRVILKLFGASTASGFVRWIYETTRPLIAPFIGIFPTPQLEGGYVVEFSTLFALIVYAFLGYLIVEAVEELVERNTRRRKTTIRYE